MNFEDYGRDLSGEISPEELTAYRLHNCLDRLSEDGLLMCHVILNEEENIEEDFRLAMQAYIKFVNELDDAKQLLALLSPSKGIGRLRSIIWLLCDRHFPDDGIISMFDELKENKDDSLFSVEDAFQSLKDSISRTYNHFWGELKLAMAEFGMSDEQPKERETVRSDGYVENPTDPNAYFPANEIMNKHTPQDFPLTMKKLIEKVEDYGNYRIRWTRPKTKAGKPNPQRRNVHVGDWRNHVKDVSGIDQSESDPSEDEIKEQKKQIRGTWGNKWASE